MNVVLIVLLMCLIILVNVCYCICWGVNIFYCFYMGYYVINIILCMVVDIGDMLDIVIWYVSVTLIVGYRHPFTI